MFRCVARVTACAMLLVLLCVTAAQGQVEPYGTNDYGGFRNILPPGINGFDDVTQVESDYPINDEPGHDAPVHGTPSTLHQGSAFDVGFYGIVQKDLRSVLHDPETGKLNRVYCGNGSLASCRAALESSLAAAVAETPAQVYPADGVCQAGDQMCHDAIQFRAIGAITQPLMDWVNRPTFQQADEIQGHGPG